MTQITLIKLGVIAIGIATVPLSLAQTPRTGISGSNKTAATIGTAAGHTGLSGNFPSAVQTGTNFRGSTSTGPTANVGAHIGINAGAQTGISNSNRWDHRRRRWGIWWLNRQRDRDYADWDKCPDWRDHDGEHERRSQTAAASLPGSLLFCPKPSRCRLEAHCLTTAPSAQTSRLRGNPLRRYHRPRSPRLRAPTPAQLL